MTDERQKSLKRFVRSYGISSRLIAAAPLVLSPLLLAGCMGAPTYGTGTPADAQLLSDVTGIVSLGPKEKPHIDYKPRPALVKPAKDEVAVLPPPQDDIATSSNPQWPEAPEAKRARLRAEATANQDNSSFEPEISSATSSAPQRSVLHTRGTDVALAGGGPDAVGNQSAEFKRRQAQKNQGNPTERRYLSEPPLAYRQPASTAASGELGEDEWKKEKDNKKAALKNAKKKGFQMSDLWPF